MESRFLWINGRIVPAREAVVSAEDRGLLNGEGAFEALRVYGGRPFRLLEHLHRLRHSLDVVGIDVPGLEDRLQQAVHDAIAANQRPDARVRITVTAGPEGGEPAVIVGVSPLPDRPARWYAEGVGVIISRHIRDATSILSGLKSTNYLLHRMAAREAREQGAEEALLLNSWGRVAEGATSNIFMVLDEVLVSTPLSEGVLEGITRDTVLDLARAAGIKTTLRPIMPEELQQAEELFITSSVREVLPVTKLSHQPAGGGRRGPVTEQLLRAYRQEAGNPDPVPGT